MWLINSSIGRKVVMSVTGVALILFLTFHMSMNIVALFSAEGYNMICEFLGANWYALVATAALGGLTLLHIVYAFWLTMQNRKARGNSRYEVTASHAKVEWASKNMLVLGIIVILGMLLHLWNFWYNMMLAELMHWDVTPVATDGFGYIVQTFSCPVFVVLYLVWLAALWFHLSHGFWSALQTLGWNGKTWFCRWKVIGLAYTTLLILGFVVVVLAFAFKLAPSLCCAENVCDKATTTCVAAKAACMVEDCAHHADCQEPCAKHHADCKKDCDVPCDKKPCETQCPEAEADCPKVKGGCPEAKAVCPNAKAE